MPSALLVGDDSGGPHAPKRSQVRAYLGLYPLREPMRLFAIAFNQRSPDRIGGDVFTDREKRFIRAQRVGAGLGVAVGAHVAYAGGGWLAATRSHRSCSIFG